MSEKDWDEYSLIQDKLDRIGDFRFRVKTWSTTIIGALLFAGITAKIHFLMYLVLVLPVFAFWLYELHQLEWQRALRDRAKQLDASFRRQQMLEDTDAVERWEGRLPQSIEHSIALRTKYLKRKTWGKYFLLLADEWFYTMEILLIVITSAYVCFKGSDAVPQPVTLTVQGPVDVNVSKPITIDPQSTIPIKVSGVDLQFPQKLSLEMPNLKVEQSGTINLGTIPKLEINDTSRLEFAKDAPLNVVVTTQPSFQRQERLQK